jgi:MraZ protein
MMAKINKLNRFVKKNNDFIRRFTAGVKVVDIDSLRVLIPKDLISLAVSPRKSFFFRCQHSGNLG